MSKFAEALREAGIYNNHNLLTSLGEAGKDIAVDYHAPAEGRLGWGDVRHTRVWSPSHKVGDDGRLRRDSKHFLGSRSQSFPAAVAWAEDQYKLKLAVSPFGGRVPDYVVAAAKKLTARRENNGDGQRQL